MKKAPLIYGIIWFLSFVFPIIDLLSDSPDSAFKEYMQYDSIRAILTYQLIPAIIATIYFLNPFKTGLLQIIYERRIQIAVSLTVIIAIMLLQHIEVTERIKLPYHGEVGDKHGDYFVLVMLYYPLYLLFKRYFPSTDTQSA